MSSTKSRVISYDMSGNNVSRVWRDDDLVFKEQPKFLTENEIWCLHKLYPSGFVPSATRVDIEAIGMEYIESTPVTSPHLFMSYYDKVIEALREAGIRHGDLSIYGVIPHMNKPYLIDFAESRLFGDPRPDKRPEGDEYLLYKTMRQYAGGLKSPHT